MPNIEAEIAVREVWIERLSSDNYTDLESLLMYLTSCGWRPSLTGRLGRWEATLSVSDERHIGRTPLSALRGVIAKSRKQYCKEVRNLKKGLVN